MSCFVKARMERTLPENSMSSPLLAKFFLAPENKKKSVKKMKLTSEWSVFPLVRHCISEKTVETVDNSRNAQDSRKTVEMHKNAQNRFEFKSNYTKESCKLNLWLSHL